MEFSDKGILLLKELEGFQPLPYNDEAGHATIGYGTLLHKGNVTPEDRSRYMEGISENEAQALLLAHVNKSVVPALALVKPALNQNQYDALVCFVYNIGAQAFKDSTCLRMLNLGLLDAIPDQFKRWIFANGRVSKGLAKRRAREVALWKGEI